MNFIEYISDMNKTLVKCLVLACLSLVVSCAKPVGDKFADSFENQDAVDLSEVVNIYEAYSKAEKEGSEYDLSKALEGSRLDCINNGLVLSDTAFAVQLPQYAGSKQPFLADAQDFYNSCRFTFDIWSNFDLWLRSSTGSELVESADVIEGTRKISENCISDKKLRVAANNYKDSLMLLMSKPYEEWCENDNSMDLLLRLSGIIEKRAYKYYSRQEDFVDSLTDLGNELRNATKAQLETYQHTDSLNRLRYMLGALNECSTFDEQCSLFLNWIDSKEAEMDDEWIIAVAGRLIDSGKYNPCLNDIWLVWRCLFQIQYCGISRDSSIPNGFYNDMRKKCYLTCLKRIESHPDDVFAMNCAAFIGERTNINRIGQALFGNEALTEMAECLPGRFVDGESGEDGSE